ncbi:E3 ubiquitin-protein ligase BRE1-like 2 isoform X1 [Selaginella moellendorffii]|uniref:E3 ubiquitin-protein ligase BRE1-like 2 isoform X1 n=1 Tax=Selaginella moellendorffii TaxID=88036 RepID=UPI000D1C4A11|nr:E3 ubiquitin-protein ligase BRE1-like 2 isoform X1 [Selaginella moellendorffii]|eukprot:XP_024516712.1 E3 ubiquitin-protein ligase BRE1-like 2 isoform X1 [Selaginella moellendorffii]
MGSTEESERKRRHSNNHTSLSPPPKKQQPMAPVLEERKADPGMLQYQNQQLAQKLDAQRSEIHALEDKFNQLKSKQTSFDETLISVNRCWKELVDDLELLAVNAHPDGTTEVPVLEVAPPVSSVADKPDTSSVIPEETFLQRLVRSSASTEGDTLDAALNSRRASTVKTMSYIVQVIQSQRAKHDELTSMLKNQLSSDVAGKALQKAHDDLLVETQSLRTAMEALHLKHKEISSAMTAMEDSRLKDRAEIGRLTGELEDTLAELDTSRRKLAAALRNQKDLPPGPPTPGAVTKEPGEKGGVYKTSKDIRDLEELLERTKALSECRLVDLQEAHQKNLNLAEQLRRLQDSHIDEQRVISSRPYLLLQDQLKFFKAELDRCQANAERFQAERDSALRHEKEVSLKAEAGEAARRDVAVAESRITALEAKLQQCMADRDDLQLRVEELNQLSGRKDTVAELKLMISTLHKEMGMMQLQLNKYKDAAHEVCSLRADSHSMAAVLERKKFEFKNLSKKLADQAIEADVFKEEIRVLKESEQELKLILDMYEKESIESRDILEIQQSECRARAQIQRLQEALDEHSLELRVKTANEAEAACQQRLAAAEAEIAELRERLDVSDRDKMELLETIKAKSEEGDAYISEIETIGQAYEDMQTQNQRLLQQISERDDYNTKLVAESLKAKQLQTSLVAEKQSISGKMQLATSAADLQKQRAARFEEQVRLQLDQLTKAADETRHSNSAVEVARRKLAEAEREVQSLRSALEVSDKELRERGEKTNDVLVVLENERFEKKRLENELTVLKTKHTTAQENALVEKLQEEVNKYRTLLKCSVCHDRQKEVAITKCLHLFCNPCIQRNLEIRHRKCPGCGVGFGAGDVRHVYL